MGKIECFRRRQDSNGTARIAVNRVRYVKVIRESSCPLSKVFSRKYSSSDDRSQVDLYAVQI